MRYHRGKVPTCWPSSSELSSSTDHISDTNEVNTFEGTDYTSTSSSNFSSELDSDDDSSFVSTDYEETLTDSGSTSTPDTECLGDGLHEHTNHTLTSLYTAVMLFVIKHTLSGDAFSDLLHLISTVIPEGTKFVPSVYKLKETLKNYVGFSEPGIKRFCEQCQSFLPDDEKQCVKINCRDGNFKVLKFYDLICLLQVTTPMTEDGMCDITSGMVYKSTVKPVDADIFLTFTMNTDGVTLFSSSKKGNLWPVYLAVNEIPVTLRFSRKFLIPCYIFCQMEKPNMLTYLAPLTNNLVHLFEKGVEVVNSSGKFLVKAKLIAVSLDLPARALVSNMKQFNGKSACCVCQDEGCSAPGAPLRRYYPYEEHIALRTHQTILRDAKRSILEAKAVNGIKGLSILGALKYVDMSKIFVIDWMHCVLLGITKSIMGFWFSGVHRNKDFYIGIKMDLLNKRLLGIKIPEFVSRTQRPLQEYTHWKATECREWLLHFSVPVLLDGLHADAYVHFLLLVTAVFILNSDKLTEDGICYAEKLSDDFCFIYPQIYGLSGQTMNIHLLRHLGRNCRLFGPLFSHYCFGFESMNSYLKGMVHGTRHVNSQVSFAVSMTKGLTKSIKQFSDENMSTDIRALILKLGSKITKAEAEELPEDVLKVLGKKTKLQNCSDLSNIIRNEIRTDQEILLISRLQRCNVVYKTKKHQTAKKGKFFWSFGINDSNTRC